MIDLAERGSRADPWSRETTRIFRRLREPSPVEPPPGPTAMTPKGELYLHAPAPWPRGQFRTDAHE